MAAVRSGTPVDQPLSDTSSEEDEETSEEEVDAESEESEGREQETPQTQSSPIQKSQTSSESESESESESTNDFIIKPILTSKPIHLSPKAPESSSKSSLKRTTNSKAGEEDCPAPKTQEKKSGGNQLWTDDDQIALLRGMIQFQSEKGADPLAKMTDFYEFLKGTLCVTYSKKQMYEKGRKLKKKFSIHCENGDVSTFNPIDYEIFALSKKICDSKSSSGKGLDVSSGVAAVEASNENKEEKKRKAHKDEENGEKIKKKQKTAQGAVDEQTTVIVKDKQTVSNGKDDQAAAERKGIQTIADEGENDQAISKKGNGKQIAMNVVQVEMEKGKDFRSTYPHFLNSLSAKYYPLATVETLGILKEKATLLDCSVAEKIEKKWAKVLEEDANLSRMVAELVSQQIRLVLGEVVTL